MAEASFLKANIYNPNNIVYMVNLAATYERDKNYNSALQIYEDVYKLDKNYKDVAGSILRVKTLLSFAENPQNQNINKNFEYNEDMEVKPIGSKNYTNNANTNR